MWAITHAACGAVIGHHLHTFPLLVTSGSLLSHAVLDAIPHWDYADVKHTELWAASDLVLAILLTQALTRYTDNPQALALGALMGVLPDLEVALRHLGVIKRTYFPSHRPGFPHGKSSLSVGSVIQIILTLFFVCLVLLTD